MPRDPAVLDTVDGVLIPGGFGSRGMEGKIRAAQYARENNIPFLGICLGLQCAVIEFARNRSPCCVAVDLWKNFPSPRVLV